MLIHDIATFPQGLDDSIDIVYSAVQCRPSVMHKRKNDLGTMDEERERWDKIGCILKLYI